MGINKPETHEVVETNEKKERSNFAPESTEAKTQREISEQDQVVNEQTLDDILASGYQDAPVAAPAATIRQQDNVRAEELISRTESQIAEKFGDNAFARFTPEQFA